MKIKAVCINLERFQNRKQHMMNCIDKINIPFEFFKAYDYKTLQLKDSDIKIDLPENDDDDYNIKVSYTKDIYAYSSEKNEYIFTGLKHDPKAFLIDKVEEFGRTNLRKYHNIPYADGVECKDFIGDHSKKWIYRHGEQLYYVDISNFRKYLSISEIACALSHYKVLEKLVNDPDYDAYLILEDDVELRDTTDDSKYNFDNVMKHIELYKTQWDIVFLNRPFFYTPEYLYPVSELLNIGIFCLFSNACSYIVSKKGAQQLLDAFKGEINIEYDEMLSRQQHLRMFRTRESVFETNISIASNSGIRVDEIETEMELKFKNYNDGIIE